MKVEIQLDITMEEVASLFNILAGRVLTQPASIKTLKTTTEPVPGNFNKTPAPKTNSVSSKGLNFTVNTWSEEEEQWLLGLKIITIKTPLAHKALFGKARTYKSLYAKLKRLQKQ